MVTIRILFSIFTDSPQPIVVTGPPGSGKSALLCNLVLRLKHDRNYAIVYHFIGFAEGSTGEC